MLYPSVRQQSSASTAFVVVTIIVVKLLLLHLMGRPFSCDCGVVTLWQGGLDPSQNSQQFADHYSLLHAGFGMILIQWLAWMRPHWRFPDLLVVVVASSAIWEIMENTPLIIERFGMLGSDLHYSGDSLLNSLGDTIFVLAGAVLAMKLSRLTTLVLVTTIEITVYLLIGDSILFGMFRFFAGSTMGHA